MASVAGMPLEARGERLAGTIAETRAALQAGEAEFAVQLRAAIARVGRASGVSSVGLFRVRRTRTRGPRWRTIASWTAAGGPTRAVAPGGRWAPVAEATRVDAATIGAPGRRRPVTLVTEVGRRRGELRVCVFLVIDGRRDAALVFVGADERIPTTAEHLAFAEAGRVLGGALHDHLRERRERRRHVQRRELEQLRRRVYQLESRVEDALALQRSAEEHASELSRANEVMGAAIARLVQADDLVRFLSDMLCETLRVAGAQGGAIVVLGPEGADHVVLRARDGFLSPEERERRGLARLPYDEFTNALIARLESGETVSVHDVCDRTGAFPDFHRAEGNRLVRLVPMRASSRLVGWIGLGFADPHPPGGARDTMLRVLADQMTLAVELTRLAGDARATALARQAETALRERMTELAQAYRALGHSIARLTATGDLPAFLGSILADAVTTAGAVSGILLQRERGDDGFEPVAHVVHGELLDLRTDRRHAEWRRPMAPDSPWVLDALACDEIRVTDLATDDPSRPEIAAFRARGYRWMTFAPLREQGDPVGFLGLGFGTEEPPDASKLELARVIAQQATLAARLTRVAEDGEALAVARERERLAEQRASELAAGAAAISRSLERLRDVEQLDGFLDGLLRELIAATGAVSGGIQLFEPRHGALVTRLLILHGERLDLDADPRVAEFADPVSIDGQFLWREIGTRDLLWLDLQQRDPRMTGRYHAWHARHGHRYLAMIPMLLGQELVGLVGLAYGAGASAPPCGLRELFRQLVQHAALAVRLGRLASDARVAAVDRERIRAAEAHAAELAIANRALSHSVTRLTDLDHVDGFLGSVVEELTRAVGAVTGCVYLYDPSSDLLTCHTVMSRGRRVNFHVEPIAAPFLQPIRASGHPIWASLQRHEVHWFDYAHATAAQPGRFAEWHAAQRHRFAAAVPMLHGDVPIGFIGLGFDADAAAPSELRVELCRSLAQHAAIALRLDTLAARARDAAVLGERTRLARDMHDTVAQGLTAILLQLQAAQGPVAVEQRERFVQQAVELARDSLVEARRAVYALRAVHAEGADLGAALDAGLKPLFAGSLTRVRLEVDGPRRRVDAAVEDELLRIAQEVAVNALKHAHAAEFSVRLRFDAAGVELRLADDGRGFEPDAPSEGFGLRGMRERAARLKAHFYLRTAPGAGTEVTVTVPAPLR